MERVVLGLGSNKEYGAYTPEMILEGAARDLEKTLSDLRAAPLYETAPLHIADQPNFLNTAVSGFYARTPHDLLREIQAIEAAWGRNRAEERRFGERTLDIDILLFGGRVCDEACLTLPHPRLHERAFALAPLLDLLPEARDPRAAVPYRVFMDKARKQDIRRYGGW
jgi:2-amino-4-hydroxy-6-hydroxymethyldihydropteridine diphosphokinase